MTLSLWKSSVGVGEVYPKPGAKAARAFVMSGGGLMAAALVPCGFCRATNLDHYVPFNCNECQNRLGIASCKVSIHIHHTDGSRSFVMWTCPTCGPKHYLLKPEMHKALVDIYGVRAFVIPPEVDSRPRGRAVSQDDVWDFVIDMALWDGSLSELARG